MPPDEPLFDSPEDLVRAYEAGGFQGYQPSERDKEEFLSTNPVRAFAAPSSGAGKRALLWGYTLALDPGAYSERQTVGDCFVAGTLVRMSDGTEKAIEDVRAGDYIASPFGGIRKVVSTLAKPYAGEVVTARAEGCVESITATPDHKFVSHACKGEWQWKEVGGMDVGDRVFLPSTSIALPFHFTYDLACESGCDVRKRRRKSPAIGTVRAKGCRTDTVRQVVLDAEVAWMVGLWLAEGSTEKSRRGEPNALTWNLCKDEMDLAVRVQQVARSAFGVDSRIYTIASKPNCLFVKVSSVPMARWMHRICGQGNTYSKRVPKEVFISDDDVRLACLQGWMQGDGCAMGGPRPDRPQYLRCKATGVSVSRGLARDMKYLAASCGILCSDTVRKARGRSREAIDLHFYGENAVAIFPDKLTATPGTRKSSVWRVHGGFAPRLKSVERQAFDGMVYCIGVEYDHAFIANGYAVHNCVSHGSRNARDVTRAVSLLVNGDPFSWHRRTATEPTYGARGHGGEGMSPARASKFERDVGFCPREDFPGIVNLEKYDGHIGARWGRQGGVPSGVQDLCRRNKVGTIANVRTVQDAMSALYNGYGIHSGQMAAWSSRPNSQNIHPRSSPGWAHDMATVGYDDTKEFWPFTVFFVPNSWGRWNTPVPDWPASYPPQPPGMIVTKAEDWEVCVRGGDCWVYSDVQGFPPRTLPDLGSIGRI
jgi:hypothetical protein